MEKNNLNRLMAIVSLVLMIAGIIFLCISLFGSGNNTTPLACALVCILLANFLNLIRSLRNKNK